MPRKKYYPGYQVGGPTTQQDTTYPGPRFDPLSEEDIDSIQAERRRKREILREVEEQHPSVWERIRDLPIVRDMRRVVPRLPGVMWDAAKDVGGGIWDLLTPDQKEQVGPRRHPGSPPGPPQRYQTRPRPTPPPALTPDELRERERRLRERWDSEGRTAMGLDEEFDRLKMGSGVVGLHSGGNIPSHEHGEGPRQHLVTNLEPSRDEGSGWNSYPVHYRMAGMSAGDTLHVSPEGVEGYLAPEAQALRDLDMGRIERENTRFQLAEEERRNEGLSPFDIMDREVAALDSLRAGTLGRETVDVPLPNTPEWEAMREAQEAYIRRRRLGPMGDPTIGRANGGIVGLQTGGAVPQQTTVTQQNMPVQTEQYWADTTKHGMDLTAPGQPYQEYGGQRLAGFTDPQVAGMAGISAYGKGAGPQGTIQAGQAYGQAQGMLGSAANQMAGLSGQYGTIGSKFGAFAPLAQQQAQTAATGMTGAGTAAKDLGTTAQTTLGTTGTAAQAGGAQTAENLRAMGATAADPTTIAGQDLSGYMSQYTQGALDPQIAAIRQAAAQQRSEIGSEAALAGAGGSYRHGLREGAVDVGEQAQIGKATGEAYQQALLNAQQQFRGDQAAKERGLATQIGTETGAGAAGLAGLSEQGRLQQAGAQTGLLGMQQQAEQMGQAGALQQRGFETMGSLWGQQQGALTGQANLAQQQGAMAAQMGQLGAGMGNLGAREQQQQLERLQAMQNVGKEQQAAQQQSLNMGYQDWQNRLNKPFEDLQKRMQILSSTPYRGSTSTSQYGPPPPSGFNQLMNAGLSGLQIWKQMRGQQAPPTTLDWPTGYNPNSGGWRRGAQYHNLPQIPGGTPPVMQTNVGQPYVPPGSVGGPHQYDVNAPGAPQWPSGMRSRYHGDDVIGG